jgi:hypothetical protein
VRAASRLLVFLVGALVGGALGGCPRGARPGRDPLAPPPPPVGSAPSPEPAPDRPFRDPTPLERRRIEDLLARIPVATADERVEIDRAIARHGPCALGPLVEALRAPDERVRAASAYLLGVLRDRRTVPALLAATSDPATTVRLEAAGALATLGDDRGLDVLVEGLLHPDARVRSKCAAILEQETGRRFGYAADASREEREDAARRWRTWLGLRRAESPPPAESSEPPEPPPDAR